MGWKMLLTAAMFAAMPGLAAAYDGIVEKKRLDMADFTTSSGRMLKRVHVGYETYGTLNAAKDNVILVTHFFSGTSHAAGRYAVDDKAPGYWDSIIGPGKALDTDKYFVVSSDTLLNLNTRDPKVVTTGPASIDPDTGQPYGMTFPVVGIRDFVAVQKALLDSLGIRKLKAVIGASMGSMQAVQWAADYPDMVERAIAVIPPGLENNGYVIGALAQWAAPIRLDPRWNKGDYYGREEPLDGLAAAFAGVTLSAVHYDWAAERFARRPADPAKDPQGGLDHPYAVEDGLAKGGAARAKGSDANHFLYLVRANQLYSVVDKVDRIKARILFVPARSDLLFPPAMAYEAAAILKARGKHAEVVEIPGQGGHLDGVFKISAVAPELARFLSQ